jgi:transcriptional regulator with XRE-family HTH domain
MHKELKSIRKEIKLSMSNFARILKISKPAFQGYESGRRSIPQEVMAGAQAQLQRTRQYWAEMDKRMDEEMNKEATG